MMRAAPTQEGFVTVSGRRTWYRSRGERGDGGTLVLIHGGPGMPGEAMIPLEELAADRQVVRYDQIGCGRSDWPDDPSLWCVSTFVEELAALRDQLGLDRVHLLGWSWGGSLALEYMFTKPEGVLSMTLASAPFSTQLWADEVRRLCEDLPPHVRETFDRFEKDYRARDRPRREGSGKVAAGMTTAKMNRIAKVMRLAMPLAAGPTASRLAHWASSVPPLRAPAFEVASMEFLRRHVCRLDSFPLPLLRGIAGWNKQVYEAMWGPSEFIPAGVLADWDVEDRLGELDVPTLITSGAYDEATAEQMRRMRAGIAGSRWELFEQSAHIAFFEEAERYREILKTFLDEVDAGVANG